MCNIVNLNSCSYEEQWSKLPLLDIFRLIHCGHQNSQITNPPLSSAAGVNTMWSCFYFSPSNRNTKQYSSFGASQRPVRSGSSATLPPNMRPNWDKNFKLTCNTSRGHMSSETANENIILEAESGVRKLCAVKDGEEI